MASRNADAKQALDMLRAYIRHWEQDVLAGLTPTHGSLERALGHVATIERALNEMEAA